MADTLNDTEQRTLRDYDLLRDACGLLELSNLAGIILRGDDRKGWLQGQVTNDVRRLESGNSRSFCLCSPTGQITAVVDAWALPEQIVMTTATDCLAAVQDRVERMVIMEDVTGEPASDTYQMVSVQGPTATKRLSELVTLPNLDAGLSELEGAEVWCLRADRTGMGGWDIWLPNGRSDLLARFREAFAPVCLEAYEIARLEAGIPSFGADVTAKTLPPELGPAFEARHVSYHKGCYVGQEVLMRIHSRGHTNKMWVGLLAESELEVGAAVAHGARQDMGVVTSAVLSPDFGPIGAAMLRNEAAENGETVRVTTSRGVVEAEVRRMPLLRLE